jgi:hypothetical protein
MQFVQVTMLDFSSTHAASYSSFVDIIRFNLLTSDWCVWEWDRFGGGRWAALVRGKVQL